MPAPDVSPNAPRAPSERPPEFKGYAVVKELRTGAFYKARVLKCRKGSEPCVIKDLSPMRPLFRWYGRQLLAREARLMERLEGAGVAPRLLARISRDAIAIEFIRCDYLGARIRKAGRMPRVLEQLEKTVDKLHRRNVAHLDLRQRKNVLVRDDDSVVLIDFESSWDLDRGVMGRLLRGVLFRADRNALVKWRVKFLPTSANAHDVRAVKRHERWKKLWFFKSLGRAVRRILGGKARPRHVKTHRKIQKADVS